MGADDVAVLVAAGVASAAAVGSLVTVALLGRRVRDLRRVVADLQGETLPLVHQARVAAEEAATEMTRVGDVLESAESVSATVDSASRLAYRAFANPVVRTMAFGTGLAAALRRLFGRDRSRVPGGAVALRPPSTDTAAAPSRSRRHRRRRRAVRR